MRGTLQGDGWCRRAELGRVRTELNRNRRVGTRRSAPAPHTSTQVMAAGLFVSGCVVLLGLTRLFGLVNALVPGAVIRGMQLGLGLQLALKASNRVASPATAQLCLRSVPSGWRLGGAGGPAATCLQQGSPACAPPTIHDPKTHAGVATSVVCRRPPAARPRLVGPRGPAAGPARAGLHSHHRLPC